MNKKQYMKYRKRKDSISQCVVAVRSEVPFQNLLYHIKSQIYQINVHNWFLNSMFPDTLKGPKFCAKKNLKVLAPTRRYQSFLETDVKGVVQPVNMKHSK